MEFELNHFSLGILNTLAKKLQLRKFSLRTLACAGRLGLSFGIIRLGTSVTELSLGMFRLVTFVWDLSLRTVRSGSFAWELLLGIVRFETCDWKLWLEIFRLRTFTR